jgi:uncharacterized protein YhdP
MRLDGAQLRIAGIGQPVRALTGAVQFGEHGVRADGLQGELYGSVLQASVHAEGDSPDGVVRVVFDVPAAADDGLLAAFVPAWLRRHLHGSSRWTARLPLAGAHSGQLSLETDLRGTASDLPAPLAKDAAAALPLEVTVIGAMGGGGGGGGGAAPLRVLAEAGDRLRLALRFGRQAAPPPSSTSAPGSIWAAASAPPARRPCAGRM